MLSRGAARMGKVGELCLDGVFVAITTPFLQGSDQQIDKASLKSNLKLYEDIPFAGYLVAGTNGEAPYLTPDERIALVKTVRENTKKIVIGGATAESTRGATSLAESMNEAGADAVLVQPPCYFRKKMTEEALEAHFVRVAEGSGLPLIVYNSPGVTGIDMSTETLGRLARHPLIRAVKDNDVRKCALIVQETKHLEFDVLISMASNLLGGLQAGCSGGTLGLANIMGKEVCEIYQHFKNGRFAEAIELQNQIIRADCLLLSSGLGVPAIKAAMDLLGYTGGVSRLPLLPLTSSEMETLQGCLTSVGLLGQK